MPHGLSETEYEIMELLWKSDHPLYFYEIMDYFEKNGKKWQKQTLHTHLSRLIAKGILTNKKQGNKNIYYPKTTIDKLIQAKFINFLNDSFNGSLNKFISSITGNKKLYSKEDWKELKDFLNSEEDY